MLNREAAMCGVTTIGRGGGDLSGQRGRSHLAAGHTVDRIVDENRSDLLTAGRRMDNLRRADGG